MNINQYEKLCTGCGLCNSACDVKFKADKKGFPTPMLETDNLEFCNKVCPASGNASNNQVCDNEWGHYISVFSGWSASGEIRNMASSGGVLTTICCFLLENKLVDGIIQSKVDASCVYGTQTVISVSTDDVKSCSGSRYSVSSPLMGIEKKIEAGKTYAFVGKPCDVSALRMYMDNYPDKLTQIKYMFSFFCAGIPSEDAQIKLLNSLNCENIDDCVSLRYRGNGWPGYATVRKIDGKEYKMSYDDSWGKILGRDVRECCRFCFDGIGEFADISCGDYWYINEDKKPDFSEKEGRNIIFGRTELGAELLGRMIASGYIVTENCDLDELRYVQKYQYERKHFMKSMIYAMKICGREYPRYNALILNAYSKKERMSIKARRMLGTFKRVKKGDI